MKEFLFFYNKKRLFCTYFLNKLFSSKVLFLISKRLLFAKNLCRMRRMEMFSGCLLRKKARSMGEKKNKDVRQNRAVRWLMGMTVGPT